MLRLVTLFMNSMTIDAMEDNLMHLFLASRFYVSDGLKMAPQLGKLLLRVSQSLMQLLQLSLWHSPHSTI
jgi:hypothetical protein